MIINIYIYIYKKYALCIKIEYKGQDFFILSLENIQKSREIAENKRQNRKTKNIVWEKT